MITRSPAYFVVVRNESSTCELESYFEINNAVNRQDFTNDHEIFR